MKTNKILAVLTVLFATLFTSRADFFTATNNGTWGDTNIWDTQTLPGPTDDVFIAAGINVIVDTNASAQTISDDTTGGTVTMAPNSTLSIFGNNGTDQLTLLNATNKGSTVIYFNNPFFAKQCDYYNLVFANTNYVDPLPPFSPWQFFNNFSSVAGPTPMTIAGNMTLMGAVEVQQGTDGPGVSSDISIGGNLIIGPGCAWDSSGANLTVVSNTFVYGLMEDLNGGLGSNYFGGNVIVAGPSTSIPYYPGFSYTNGWYVSDVTTWGVGGNLTNNGSIFGFGFGSISFDGTTGSIAGTNTLTIPTVTVNGSYAIGTSITLITNTPTLNGTLVFDIANPKQITLLTNAGTALYYNGNLNVINSGSPPASGTTYALFNSTNGYAGVFASTSYPSLPAGLTWDDSMLLTNGSITVIGGSAGSPKLTQSRSGGILTLSWDSAAFPGYSVQGQTNKAGIGDNWSDSGVTTSPFTIAINPTNPPVFFRLSKPL
jgi:hypothetical protein